jgi:hypothetical protein
MRLRGRQIIEPKIFKRWWKTTTNNANAERSDEIFDMVKNLTWVRMVAGREFDPRGLSGEINKGKMVKSEHCDPNYQYYYWANDGKDKLYLLSPKVSKYSDVGNNRWSLQSYGSNGWSLGINPPEGQDERILYVAINKQHYP